MSCAAKTARPRLVLGRKSNIYFDKMLVVKKKIGVQRKFWRQNLTISSTHVVDIAIAIDVAYPFKTYARVIQELLPDPCAVLDMTERKSMHIYFKSKSLDSLFWGFMFISVH